MDTDFSEIFKKKYIQVAASICFGINIMFLCLQLIVFLINKHGQTIMGKNFAMFCFSLLIGHVTFICSIIWQNENFSCAFIVFIGHYIYLTHSTWLLVTSIEAYKSINSTKTQQIYDKNHSWRFLIYSAFTWIEPAIIAALPLYAEYNENSIFQELKPNLSAKSCHFEKSYAFLMFYIIPVNINLIFNFIVIGAIVGKLYNGKKLNTISNDDITEKFVYYLKLNILVGVTWITGLIGEYLKSEVLTASSILMDTIVTLYIFLIFTINDKISIFLYYADMNYDLKILEEKYDKDNDVDTSEIANMTKI
ncbi:hypothetical protein PGB90_000318 [Kerria lacca]